MISWLISLVFETTYAPEISIFTPAQPIRDATTPSPTWPRSPPSTLGGLPHQAHTKARSGTAIPNGVITEEATLVQPVSLRQGRGPRLSFLGGRKKDHTPKEVNGDNHAIPEEAEPISSNKSNTSAKDGATTNRRSFFRTLPQVTTTVTADAGTASARAGHGGVQQVQTNGTDSGNTSATDAGGWGTEISGSRGGSSEVLASMSPAMGSFSEKDGHQARVYETRVNNNGHHQGHASPQPHGGHSSIMGHGVGSVRKRLSILRLGKKSSRERGGVNGLGGLDEE